MNNFSDPDFTFNSYITESGVHFMQMHSQNNYQMDGDVLRLIPYRVLRKVELVSMFWG